MRIALLNDTSGHANWGCGATSAGLRTLLAEKFPGATLEFSHAGPLPYRNFKLALKLLDAQTRKELMRETWRPAALRKLLSRYGVDVDLIDRADRVVLNGEGMIHGKSGHLIKLMASAAYAKAAGRPTAAINQTIDLGRSEEKRGLVGRVYRALDTVWVRDPISVGETRGLGVDHVLLAPDAAVLTPPPDETELAAAARLTPARYVAITGSSELTPNDVAAFKAVCEAAAETFEAPIVVLASTKTDLRLGGALKGGAVERVLGPELGWREAMAVIALSEALIGGRFHPMILAAIAGAPFLGFAGNTHKTAGLLKLLDHPMQELSWGDPEQTRRRLAELKVQREALTSHLTTSVEAAAARLRAAPLLP